MRYPVGRVCDINTKRLLIIPNPECPNSANHTPQPEGYLAWFEWAEKMGETHRQTRCHWCGLLNVWVLKT